MFVDSHAHLFFEDFQNDLDEILQRAQDADVRLIINPGTDLATSKLSIALAEKYEMIYACVGFHPHDASKADDQALEEIETLSHHPKVVAIGEIGLDYHYNFSAPERQREVFRKQIEIAQRRNLPIVIHSREAEEDCLRIVDQLYRSVDKKYEGPRGVFHCFPGDLIMANAVIALGFRMSFPGPVTFKEKPAKPNIMATVASTVSLDHVLLETDSPYLAPVPLRGKRNEPANIPIIAQRVAELQKKSVDEVARTTTASACQLFNISV